MATIQEARQRVEEAKKAIQQRRELIKKSREQVETAEVKLQRARKSLPDVTTQQALRGQKFGKGLKGREFRRQVIRAGKKISQKLGLVKGYESELSGYESNYLTMKNKYYQQKRR